MERGSGTKGCTKFRSRTGFEKRRLKLPFDFSRTFFVKVATRFAGFVKEHVLKTVSSFCAILYLLRLFFKESKPFLNEQRCRSSPRNFQHCTCKNFPTSHTILPKSRDSATYFAADFFMNLKEIRASIKGKLISSCSD